MILPWGSGEQHKRLMSRLAHIGNIIVITRDHHGGRVTLDRRGKPVLNYTLTGHDWAHPMRGIIQSLRIHRAAGGLEISGPRTKPHVDIPATRRRSDLEEDLTNIE